jgi:hypothetical protein
MSRWIEWALIIPGAVFWLALIAAAILWLVLRLTIFTNRELRTNLQQLERRR